MEIKVKFFVNHYMAGEWFCNTAIDGIQVAGDQKPWNGNAFFARFLKRFGAYCKINFVQR